MSKTEILGQYFTKNEILLKKVNDYMMMENTNEILEPSIGEGDIVNYLKEKRGNIKFDMYEIDNELNFKVEKDKIIFGDFLKQDIKKKYLTIVGNPPYVRTKKGNLYIDFTEKCYNLLLPCGELIFIVPSDFLKLTSASKLLNEMMENGTFTHIYHPNNEKLFENANIDIIIFRYTKNKALNKKLLYNDKEMYIINTNGLITFSEEENNNEKKIEELFNVYVGLVSGKESVYKNKELGNISILNGENKIEKYILIEKYPSDNKNIDNYLLIHKEILLKREIRKFNDKNWFEWGAPRNIEIIKKNLGKDCIYIYNLTRKKNISFIGKVNYFGGNLLMLIPKINNPSHDLNKISLYLNSDKFKQNFIFSGRFKIGHRQISNSLIPNEILNN